MGGKLEDIIKSGGCHTCSQDWNCISVLGSSRFLSRKPSRQGTKEEIDANIYPQNQTVVIKFQTKAE